jgi:hypothetical protein
MTEYSLGIDIGRTFRGDTILLGAPGGGGVPVHATPRPGRATG